MAWATPTANCDICEAVIPEGILIIPELIMLVTAMFNALLTDVQLTFPFASVYVTT